MGKAAFTIALNAYRFYEDGTENGSAALGTAQDTAISRDVTSDIVVHVRLRIQETGGASGNFSAQLRRKLNTGSFTNVTASSSVVRSFNSSSLTDGAATSQRLSAGSGSFVAAVLDDVDGLIPGTWTLSSSNYTELLWSVTLLSAGLSDGDTLTFDVSIPQGDTSTITQNVFPTINVTKGAATTVTVEIGAIEWSQ